MYVHVSCKIIVARSSIVYCCYYCLDVTLEGRKASLLALSWSTMKRRDVPVNDHASHEASERRETRSLRDTVMAFEFIKNPGISNPPGPRTAAKDQISERQ